MKKINASSDKNNRDNFLPAETLWRTAQMTRQKGMEVSPLDAEPVPLEMLGLAIGILRRRKHISHLEFAKKIDISVEELLALEKGLLPAGELVKYLPSIIQQIKIPGDLIKHIFPNKKFA